MRLTARPAVKKAPCQSLRYRRVANDAMRWSSAGQNTLKVPNWSDDFIDTSSVAPMYDMVQRLRPDVVAGDGEREALIRASAGSGYFLVPKVID